jgi:DNA-binding NarL/FixJ family response regulator
MKLRILVADDNACFLRKMVSLLEAEFEIVAAVADGHAAVEAAQSYQPDIIVLDLEMPGLNGIDVTRKVTTLSGAQPRTIICSVETDLEIVEAALQAGALGYVFKYRIETDLIRALKSAMRGERFVSPDGLFPSTAD